MKNLSLKLEEEIYSEMEKILEKIKVNRNRYINEAIEFYNKLNNRKLLARQLSKESKLVSDESMKILAEFEALYEAD